MPEPDTSKNLLGTLGTIHAEKVDAENAVIFMKLDGNGYQWFISRQLAGKLTAADLVLMLKNLERTIKRIAAQEGNKI